MKTLLKEPLVHFVLLGALLFAIFGLGPDDEAPREDRILVSAGKIEHLATLYTRTWRRPPTRAELQGLIDDYVREEAAYREGLVIGLDRDDTIIRRRLRQKLEFIAEDLTAQVTPSDEDLRAYLEANSDDFRVDPRLSFRHVYLNPETRGEAIENDIAELLVLLNGEPERDLSQLGDRILLEPGYADVSGRDIAGLFGPDFAAAVADLNPGAWSGPIASAYGVHLVRVDLRNAGRVPGLDEVRADVEREWAHAQRERAIDAFYLALIDRFDIVVEWDEFEASLDEPAPADDEVG